MYKRAVLSSFLLLTALILFACSSPPEGISQQSYDMGKKHIKEIEDCSQDSDCDDSDLFDKLLFDLGQQDADKAEYKDEDVFARTLTSLTSLGMLKIEEEYDDGSELNSDLTQAKSEYRIEIDNLRKLLGEKPKYE